MWKVGMTWGLCTRNADEGDRRKCEEQYRVMGHTHNWSAHQKNVRGESNVGKKGEPEGSYVRSVAAAPQIPDELFFLHCWPPSVLISCPIHRFYSPFFGDPPNCVHFSGNKTTSHFCFSRGKLCSSLFNDGHFSVQRPVSRPLLMRNNLVRSYCRANSELFYFIFFFRNWAS